MDIAATVLLVTLAGCIVAFIFCGHMRTRNGLVLNYRLQLGKFVFQETGDWQARQCWLNAEVASDDDWMSIRHAFTPLDKFVVGSFASEFFQWRDKQAA